MSNAVRPTHVIRARKRFPQVIESYNSTRIPLMRYKNTVTKDSVLVVDDDREIRTLLCDYLEQNGYRANAVPDGKAMWAAL
jgi:PleD family two-component response regulator